MALQNRPETTSTGPHRTRSGRLYPIWGRQWRSTCGGVYPMLLKSFWPTPSSPSRHTVADLDPLRLDTGSINRANISGSINHANFSCQECVNRGRLARILQVSRKCQPGGSGTLLAEARAATLHPPFFGFFLYYWVTDSTRHQFLLFSDMSTLVYACLRP